MPGVDGALDAYLDRVPPQDRSRLERARRKQQKPAPKDARLERLEDKLRKLEAELAKLAGR